MHILYVCHAVDGGIPNYALHHVEALERFGVQITFLCPENFGTKYLCCARVVATLKDTRLRHGSAWRRGILQIRDSRADARKMLEVAENCSCDAVILSCYSEYFSPFWAGIYRRAARKGMVIGTIAHDPVRDFVFGPAWWHRLSVRQAYSFVRHVFVHDNTPVDFGGAKPASIQVHVVPHGPFVVARPRQTREEVRTRHGFGPGDCVLLSFGQIRDGKNLDAVLRALVRLPANVKLLVAGSSGGGSQRQPEEYRRMADELGVANRCAWDTRYVPDEEVGDFFAGADFTLMTYSAHFRSASGVLNVAVACRKQVLASSGEGPLKHAVREYGLGVFVAPDDDDAIVNGVNQMLTSLPTPEWERYELENSWKENAMRVIKALRS